MPPLSASEVRSNLYRLIDEATVSHQPVMFTGKRHNAVLVSAEDWAAIQERNPLPYEKLVYQVLEAERGVKVLRLWSFYE